MKSCSTTLQMILNGSLKHPLFLLLSLKIVEVCLLKYLTHPEAKCKITLLKALGSRLASKETNKHVRVARMFRRRPILSKPQLLCEFFP